MRITVSLYIDTDAEPRGLVSVTDDEGKPIQTVGSAPIGSVELTTMMRSALYTLNAFTVNYALIPF